MQCLCILPIAIASLQKKPSFCVMQIYIYINIYIYIYINIYVCVHIICCLSLGMCAEGFGVSNRWIKPKWGYPKMDG